MNKVWLCTSAIICRLSSVLRPVVLLPLVFCFGSIILGAVFITSCKSEPIKQVLILNLPFEPEAVEAPREYEILDYKNKIRGEPLPEWVSRWLDSDVHGVEAQSSYDGRFVFVHRNEGNSFNALTLWVENFSPERDFPRMAASRIEARFSSSVVYPDEEYGDFFEILIRAASDAAWTGAVKEDDFWLHKKYLPHEGEPERESREFLILVTIEKPRFTTQLNAIFQTVNPNPPPTEAQIAAANRVKDRFYEGF